jgi:hypothetical protein
MIDFLMKIIDIKTKDIIIIIIESNIIINQETIENQETTHLISMHIKTINKDLDQSNHIREESNFQMIEDKTKSSIK